MQSHRILFIIKFAFILFPRWARKSRINWGSEDCEETNPSPSMASRPMEESRSSGGGGSAVSHESLVGEGVTSASTAVAARLGDYAEIFGDLEGSCSIPFLDLPSAFDGLDGAPPGTLAYSEVFGASYDELFAEREEASSSDARCVRPPFLMRLRLL